MAGLSGKAVLPALTLLMAALSVTPLRAADPPALHVAGRFLEDADGQRVTLRGCNLGCWLLLEPWMLGIRVSRIRDDYTIVTTLEQRFGAQRAEELLDTYRANWITAREFDSVKSFGFNVVRVPFVYTLLTTDDDPYTLRDDAFEWLDKAVDLAEQAGVYVILDMHGAPGRQSHDMPTGRVGQNELLTSDEYQRRAAWLWQRIAERYRDRAAVVAYDLLNEPWGDFKTDIRKQLFTAVDRIRAAIREVDPDTLIYLPGSLRGITFYGDPRDRGWTNCGFTEHYYPGLFGQGSPSLETHARFLGLGLPGKVRYIERLDAPYLVGEFNVVFDTAAQPELMRRYYDTFAVNGWAATMWSLRTINPQGGVGQDNWCLIANAEPFKLPDLLTASDKEIEQAFRQLGEMPLAADDELRDAMTATAAPSLPLTQFTPITLSETNSAPIAGWRNTDIGTNLAGGARVGDNDALIVIGAGRDIWADRDEFHFLCRDAAGDFSERSVLSRIDAPSRYTKAGWMLRAGDEPDAATILIHAFIDGRVMLAWRSKSGEPMAERVLAISGLPVGLGIERTGGKVHVLYTDCDGHWRREPVPAIDALAKGGLVGMAVGSHAELERAAATFLQPSDRLQHDASAANRLQNPSFETPKHPDTAADQAEHWDRWGNWFNRDTGWTPRRDGECVLGYHHWQIESPETSGVYQDVSGLRPGQRYTFSVFANADAPAAGKHGPQNVELRIESRDGDRVLNVASRDYRAADIATGDAWSHLHVAGTVPFDNARVLIVVTPAREAPRDAAIKFDAARFVSGGRQD